MRIRILKVSGKNGALVNSEFVEKDADPLPLSHG